MWSTDWSRSWIWSTDWPGSYICQMIDRNDNDDFYSLQQIVCQMSLIKRIPVYDFEELLNAINNLSFDSF